MDKIIHKVKSLELNIYHGGRAAAIKWINKYGITLPNYKISSGNMKIRLGMTIQLLNNYKKKYFNT